ncbi:hypothetical protein K1728_00745 [Weissella confusa]|uniref:hypothetical protein n=1 Tax=Weissella confusa TaxID=1583 RepID=UPI001C6F7CEA|nr:hypothetical protein [Weissella confusa]QYU57973.1 hypothetical protein K1728_00745 [Weissella confusa]
MSTRANVGVLQNDGTVKVIYSHWDGYPDYLLKTLKKYHNSLDKATALISLDDASYIGRYIEPSESVKLFGFDFMPDLPEYAEQLAKLPAEQVRRIKNEYQSFDYSIFYGRDRGETDVDAVAYSSVDEWLNNLGAMIEYAYLFKNGKWLNVTPKD